MWGWILLASFISVATKLSGYMLPDSILDKPRVITTTSAMTIGLLASLIALNTVGDGQHIVFDARLGSLAVAAVALWLRAPFLLVVVLGAAAAALLRLAGLS